jgi:NAD-dependent deacetylase
MDEKIAQLAGMINTAETIVVFTGAGMSTESGISDYRSQNGRWQRFSPVTIQEFQASDEKRKEYWRMKLDLLESIKRAKPNDGHKAIAAMEKLGKLRGLITQNIDGLHQAAGNSREKTIEIHGTNLETICLACGDLKPWQMVYKKLKEGIEVPVCEHCGGFLKPNTISFGQRLDQNLLQKAFNWAAECDLLLAVGSTLIVEPAASIPRTAKSHGAVLCIVTLSQTPLDSFADLKVAQSCGVVFKDAVELLGKY